MSGILEGRIAIITGGARGIGLATAQVMVIQGAKVVIADNGCASDGSPEDPVVAEAAAARCNQIASGHALAWAQNIAEPGAAERLVRWTIEQFGAVDIVINNAAVLRADDPFKPNRAAFDFTLSNNLSAAYELLCAAAEPMRTQRQNGRLPGTVVNVGGAAGLYGTYGHMAYSAASAGLCGLTRAAAMDFKNDGITCNAVIPFANTRSLNSLEITHSSSTEYKAANQQIGATHCANLIAWLASTQAAALNGQVLGVRGREVLLFNQPRPIRSVFTSAGVLDADALSHSIVEEFGPALTDLLSDFEVWSNQPVV